MAGFLAQIPNQNRKLRFQTQSRRIAIFVTDGERIGENRRSRPSTYHRYTGSDSGTSARGSKPVKRFGKIASTYYGYAWASNLRCVRPP
jgi:hypothetical protein